MAGINSESRQQYTAEGEKGTKDSITGTGRGINLGALNTIGSVNQPTVNEGLVNRGPSVGDNTVKMAGGNNDGN